MANPLETFTLSWLQPLTSLSHTLHSSIRWTKRWTMQNTCERFILYLIYILFHSISYEKQTLTLLNNFFLWGRLDCKFSYCLCSSGNTAGGRNNWLCMEDQAWWASKAFLSSKASKEKLNFRWQYVMCYCGLAEANRISIYSKYKLQLVATPV